LPQPAWMCGNAPITARCTYIVARIWSHAHPCGSSDPLQGSLVSQLSSIHSCP
jgi:hypothetical protein